MSYCDKPTFIEKMVNVFPGPYFLKCVIFASLFGVPLLLVTRFFERFNVADTLSIFGVPPLLQGVVTFSIANFVLVIYAVYSVRYMRQKIAQTINQLNHVTAENRTQLRRVFGPVCKFYPAAILSVLLFGATLASFPDILQHANGLLSLIQLIISFPFVYIAYGTFVWLYISSIEAIHRLGRQTFLPVSEFYDDPHFGMKPFGNLSLSLALVYFVGLGLVFFSFISIPAPLQFVVGILFASGLMLFFLPLDIFHHEMRKKKKAEEAKLKNHYKKLTGSIGNSFDGIYLQDAKDTRQIIALEIVEQQIASASEWPFDSKTLTWLSAIVLTVLGSILTRYVLLFLGA